MFHDDHEENRLAWGLISPFVITGVLIALAITCLLILLAGIRPRLEKSSEFVTFAAYTA